MFRQYSADGRRARAVLVTTAVATLATAVAVGTSSGARTASPTIAFVSQGTSNSWAAQLDAVARKTAKQLGVKLVYYNGQGDATKQLPEIQTATGPGNLSKSIFDLGTKSSSDIESDVVVLVDWDALAVLHWPLSYRSDARNWRLSNQKKFDHGG